MTKIALVTGATSGIGAATALALARDGYAVYGAGRRLDRLVPLEASGVRPVALDLTDDASIVAAVEHVLGEEGRIDLLVNNAGYGSYGAIEDVPLAEARRQVEVNLFGLARLIQLVVPSMRERRSGRIVNVTSIGGKFASSFGGWYHATKFAVEGLSDALRQEVAPFGIDVVVIEPGGIETEWAGIALETAVAASGEGAYAERVHRMARAMSGQSGRIRGSKPQVVANAIARAARVRRPRTRYAMGFGAKPILFARRVLSDRAVDRLLGRMLG